MARLRLHVLVTFGSLGGYFGTLWGHLEVTWRLFGGHLEDTSSSHGGHLEVTGGHLGSVKRHFGAQCGVI